MIWQKARLKDLVTMKYGKMPKKEDIIEEGYPIYSGYRITSFHKEYLFKEPQLIIVARGVGGTGDVKISPPFCYLTNLSIALLTNDDIVDKYFLKYRLSVQNLRSLDSGAAQSQITIGALEQFETTIPPLPIQRKIASILSAYDDLIEKNLKRIKLLEEKAQLHYKELMQNSAKWDKVRLEEFVSVVKGRKPANVLELPEEESQLYLLLDTVERGKTMYTTDLNLPQSKITDVLMCMDGARSGLSFRGMVGAIGSTMAIWRSNSERVSGEFLYQFMKQNESAITQGNTGAAIPHANRKFILDMKMAMPPKKEVGYFDSLTLPLVKLINTLHSQNTKLREARDILLPKLMSGQIEV
jgi:type I restriction enzyme S subunit